MFFFNALRATSNLLVGFFPELLGAARDLKFGSMHFLRVSRDFPFDVFSCTNSNMVVRLLMRFAQFKIQVFFFMCFARLKVW